MTAAPSSRVETEALRAALELRLGCSIAEIRRTPSLYTTTFPLEDVFVRTDDGGELTLVLKDLSPVHLGQIKPSFVFDPRREIEVYQSILPNRGLGTARCYAAVADATDRCYWLVLEKVQGAELYQVGDLGVWQAAARWLARLHVELASEAAALAENAYLLRHTAAFYCVWPARAVAHARTPDEVDSLTWLAEKHDRVVDRLVSLPTTMIHGEYYASNIVIQGLHGDVRVCPIDWEMAALGPGLMDLAALTAGSWSDGARLALTDAYREALASLGGDVLPADEFRAALDCCRLQIALEWLGWSAAWQPPLAHTQDWLAEALAAAERLGL
jgi:hypothetical protein